MYKKRLLEVPKELEGKLSITVTDMAKMLSIGNTMAYQLVHSKDFYPAFRIGKTILINMEKLNQWIDEKSGKGKMMTKTEEQSISEYQHSYYVKNKERWGKYRENKNENAARKIVQKIERYENKSSEFVGYCFRCKKLIEGLMIVPLMNNKTKEWKLGLLCEQCAKETGIIYYKE